MFVFFCVLTIVSFIGYGTSCLVARHMVVEFERYGLARFRALTGTLQLMGATGLFVGLIGFPLIGLLAATGLSLQMLLGFGVRLRIRDPWIQCLPSFAFMCVNGGLIYGFVVRL